MRPQRRSCGCINCPMCGEDWEYPYVLVSDCYKRQGAEEYLRVQAGEEAAWRAHLARHGRFPAARFLLHRLFTALARLCYPRLRPVANPTVSWASYRQALGRKNRAATPGKAP